MTSFARAASVLAVVAVGLGGCSASGTLPELLPRDMAAPLRFADDGGDTLLPYQASYGLGTDNPFPATGPTPEPRVSASGAVVNLGRVELALAGNGRALQAWFTNGDDGTIADRTVSRFSTYLGAEWARYPIVTCSSLPSGTVGPCDGLEGCCTADDYERFQARQAPTPHQPVATDAVPVATAVDAAGNVYVATQHPAYGTALTKIASDGSGCIDRNANGRIDTSKDSNGDGLIDVDCNRDGKPDDVAGVSLQPCRNGLPAEYLGLDDECVLWTSNVTRLGSTGVAALAAPGVADVWVATADLDGNVIRVDAETGRIQQGAQLPVACRGAAAGLAFDADGVGWVATGGAAGLCWFDPRDPATAGAVVAPAWGFGGLAPAAITVDGTGAIWLGGAPLRRYLPDRSKGMGRLGQGRWLLSDGTASSGGIATDTRTGASFVYACSSGSLLQVPASTIGSPEADARLDGSKWPRLGVAGCRGVAVDWQQNAWFPGSDGVSRVTVSAQGVMTAPVKKNPTGNRACPAGDVCALPTFGDLVRGDATGLHPGAPLRVGWYRLVIPGCLDGQSQPTDTLWDQLTWQATTSAGTSVWLRARTGTNPAADAVTWRQRVFTAVAATSPLGLTTAVSPNLTEGAPRATVDDRYLMVEALLTSADSNTTPTLDAFTVSYRCPIPR